MKSRMNIISICGMHFSAATMEEHSRAYDYLRRMRISGVSLGFQCRIRSGDEPSWCPLMYFSDFFPGFFNISREQGKIINILFQE